MRFLSRSIILLFLCGSIAHVNAANEWKNPDLERPKTKTPASAPTAVTKPPRRSAPAALPPATPSVLLEGQLGLDVVRVCDYQRSYDDKGSGGKIDGAFYIPKIPSGYAMIGAYAQGNYHAPSDCVLAVKPASQKSMSLTQVPGSWTRLWTDKGSGARLDGSIWQANAQSSDYVCLGNVAHQGYQQPALSNYSCVHQCLVEKIPAANRIWSSKGTGSKYTAYVYKLHNSNSFITMDSNNRPAELLDLKGNTVCEF